MAQIISPNKLSAQNKRIKGKIRTGSVVFSEAVLCFYSQNMIVICVRW